MLVVQAMENLSGLTNLTELWLGKNKITEITGIETLTSLTRLDVQVCTTALCLLCFIILVCCHSEQSAHCYQWSVHADATVRAVLVP